MVKERRVRPKDGVFDLSVDDFYFPSVELLTAQVRPRDLCVSVGRESEGTDLCVRGFQDLLSFELLDINIVQELEKVPTNTPVGKGPRRLRPGARRAAANAPRRCLLDRSDALHVPAAPRGAAVHQAEG